MPHFERTDSEVEFFWGKKKGFGGPKKDVHFYESFTYDGDEYSLYDCAYFYKEGAVEPYIGKIIRIYESPDHKKKVKVLWFFQPMEIRNWLKDNHPLEKEIFLAFGEGKSLFNINPLEAIAGKCNVLCTSTDWRNPQPSEEELKKADYIFYRTFDVGTYGISDKIGDSIAGIEVRFLFNKKGQTTKGVATDMRAHGVKIENRGTFISSKDRAHSDKSEDATKDVATDMRAHGKVKIWNNGALISETDLVQSDKLDDRPRKKMKITGTSERDKGDTRLCKSAHISDEDDRKTSNPRVSSEVKAKTRFAEESVYPEKKSLKIGEADLQMELR
ncbi:hypothetical protein QJS10_CPA08g00323 [Acorus calamus]|uniref:BAH domain-containing protein n=1 Tax=Acorus calamus TaxID=4465 RepID=A0AAV9EAA8_ACOCL|nr:hypothetical protein QJS10_CPA08g00323 [Acorus calamus]